MSGEVPRGRRATARAPLLLLRETVSNYREGTGSRSPRHRPALRVDREKRRSTGMAIAVDGGVTLVRRIAHERSHGFVFIRECKDCLKSLTRDTRTLVSRSDPITT